MEIDEFLDLQFDLDEQDEDFRGTSKPAKRPLDEINVNNSLIRDRHPEKRPRKGEPPPDEYDEDDELVALAYALQPGAEFTTPAKVEPETPSRIQQLEDQSRTQTHLNQHSTPSKKESGYKQIEADFQTPSRDESREAESAGPSHMPAVHPARNAADVKGDYITVTSGSGERVYCGLVASSSGLIHGRQQHSRRQGDFLQQPITALMAEVERAAYEAALNAPLEGQSRTVPSTAGPRAEAHQGEDLWVDRYAPRSFLELLGDEEMNREVVRWLKTWDKCVFGEDRQKPGRKAPAAKRGATKQGADLRPPEKILLICGAPGLGKTTLAHVVARHCGYRTVEINASDERTAATLQARISDAVQMQSVMGAGRPNCVIIDEIDGATGGTEGRGAIQALLKLVQAGSGKGGGGGSSASEEAEEPGAEGKQGKKKKKGAQPLCRPLIAVCNDLYAPALRPLRAVAKIVHYKKPTVERLSSRLRFICMSEGLSVDRPALATLCEKTEHDVRSCLNTLQFLSKRTQAIRASHVSGLQCAQKDMVKSAFGVWQDLFTDKAAAGPGPSSRTDGSCERLYNALADFGDSQLVLAGLQENFPHARYLDTHMARTAAITDHLADGDRLLRAVHRRSDFAALKFAPAHILAVRTIVAGPQRVQIHWPSSQADVQRRTVAQRALLQGWLADVHPTVFSTLSQATAVQEVLPALVRVMNRAVRPVAPHLFTAEERADMAAMVELLLAHGLTLSLGTEDKPVPHLKAGQPDMLETTPLSPPVHTLVHFQGVPHGGKVMPLTIRQMVVQQVQLEAIRRREAVLAQGGVEEAASAAAPEDAPGVSASQGAEEGGSQRPPSGEKRYQLTVAQRAKDAAVAGPKKAGPVRKASWLDALRHKSEMAGQHRPEPSPAAEAQDIAAGKAGQSVRYKFHEGFTNAVKRPIRMKDLL
ncbi:Chromosome transmission fidelity protein 18 homolog [Coccomyxa sp. Obi]|nr:Chromosome transmission fidelity protein 18 homolog [Coccomyxa sp. Obi]